MRNRPTPAPGDAVFYGTLGPRTRGCLDIHDHDTPCRHVCDGAVGIVGEQPEGYDADDGPPEARWLVGSQVRMVKCASPGGPYPQCLLVAAYASVSEANEWGTLNMDWEPERGGDRTFYCWTALQGEDAVPQASFQWKGADIDLTFTCPECAEALHAEGEFAYHVACPRCRTGFAVDWYVPVERVS